MLTCRTRILVCFRGSAAKANFIDDAKFLQRAHPPRRTHGRRVVRVHHGFHATWADTGTRAKVLAYVGALLRAAPARECVEVITTGHSLGGALASLAAFDIAQHCGVAQRRVSCYTFGCPRVGNHAFAAEYAEMVRLVPLYFCAWVGCHAILIVTPGRCHVYSLIGHASVLQSMSERV